VSRIPHVVDHDQAGFALQLFGQGVGGILRLLEGGALTREAGVELGQGVGEVGRLAEGDPQDPSLNSWRMASSWQRAAARVVLPKPPAPVSAVVSPPGHCVPDPARKSAAD
jgi:hypothetical protein